MARNITEVRLLNVPLESDYKHTLYFASKSAQTEWFKGKTMLTGDGFSYVRKDKCIRYPKDYDELTNAGINYLMYRNESYSDKWYYAFITKIEFVNDGNSNIYFETDVIQTWFFDYVVQPSFVEREHVTDDTIGKHTIPEGLELGEYVIDWQTKNSDLTTSTILVGSTADLNSDGFGNVQGERYGGVYSGVRYYDVSVTELNNILKELASSGKSDAITSIFIAPKKLVHSSGSPYKALHYDIDGATELDWSNTDGYPSVRKAQTLNDYTPTNKKLLTYPYCYLMVSNNSGGSAVYNYELFENQEFCPFTIWGTPTPGFSVRLIPRDYRGIAVNNLDGLNLGKFPICSWNTDVYTNWLTQNSVNIKVSQASAIAQTGLGVASMFTGNIIGGLGGVASGLSQIGSTMGQIYQHSLIPPQAEGNLNNGDVTFASNQLTFTAYRMSIKKEYAQIIDKYFNMFGYKVNNVHTPNKNHRENYWFTKTIDVNIDGNVPMEDMLKIKECYNTGITFWKNPTNIGNYNVSNKIV